MTTKGFWPGSVNNVVIFDARTFVLASPFDTLLRTLDIYNKTKRLERVH